MATQFDFAETIGWLQDIGFYDYVLPFLLVFGIFFAILEKTKVLGDSAKNINAVIAGAVGLLVIVRTDIVRIINDFLPRVSLILVVTLMMLMLIALLAGKAYAGIQQGLFGFGMIVIVIAVLLALAPQLGWDTARWITSTDKQRIIELLIFGGLIWLVVKMVTGSGAQQQGQQGGRQNQGNFLTQLANMWGGGNQGQGGQQP